MNESDGLNGLNGLDELDELQATVADMMRYPHFIKPYKKKYVMTDWGFSYLALKLGIEPRDARKRFGNLMRERDLWWFWIDMEDGPVSSNQ